jgi:hypothetical protein
VFNRSHCENVTVTRVYPELLWRARFEGLHDGHMRALTARGTDARRAELQQRGGRVATFLRTPPCKPGGCDRSEAPTRRPLLDG